MHVEHRRNKHRKIPKEYHRARGRPSVVGEQTSLAVPESIHARIAYLAAWADYTPIGPVTRWAYALGRSALMARWSAGERWDRAVRRGGHGRMTAMSLPVSYVHGWPRELECSHGAACRLAIEIGLGLLEYEASAGIRRIQLLDERLHDPIAFEHHPDRYVIAAMHEPAGRRVGGVWIGGTT